MDLDRIKDAIDDVLAAALLGEGWEPALNRFAHAAGARGLVLMRNRPDRMVAGITTEDIAEAVAAFAAGKAPPSSRYRRVTSGPRVGFRVDRDDYTEEELAADPYYQEFLRPNDLFWHANAVLMRGDEDVEISLKRSPRADPYSRTDAVLLDAVLPDLRAAARLATRSLEGAAFGMARLLQQRGDPVYQLDARGRVVATHATDPDDTKRPVSVVGRHLVARERAAQPALDRAIALAVTPPRTTTLAPLSGGNGRRSFLQIVPVPGRARDIFLATAAVAVLIEAAEPPPRLRLDAPTIGHAFALTDREADIACLLAEGLMLGDIARRLGMQVGTARVHLRNIFEKTGTSRQAELVALLGRLRP